MMLLYSIVPPEIVFNGGLKNQYPELMEKVYLGETLLVSHVDKNKYKIERLISTSPKSFINPSLQPGNIISLDM